MNHPDPSISPPTGLLARWTSLQTAWLLFAPPAVLVGLRWLFQLSTDRQPGTQALPLVPVLAPSSLIDMLWPVIAVVVVLILVVLAGGLMMRRLGWRRVMAVVGVLWLLLWLGGSMAMTHRFLNEQGLFLRDETAAEVAAGADLVREAPGPAAVDAQVLSSKFKPASLRSLGGVELVLLVSGLDTPHRLLIDDPLAIQIKPGDTLALQFSPGRFSGLFVTDWAVARIAAPAEPEAPGAAAQLPSSVTH